MKPSWEIRVPQKDPAVSYSDNESEIVSMIEARFAGRRGTFPHMRHIRHIVLGFLGHIVLHIRHIHKLMDKTPPAKNRDDQTKIRHNRLDSVLKKTVFKYGTIGKQRPEPFTGYLHARDLICTLKFPSVQF